jgi:arylsulfatase A-like enzyme
MMGEDAARSRKPIKSAARRAGALIPAMALGLAVLAATGEAARAADAPNIVVILADDMGYDAVSAYNDRLGLETPNIDRLTEQGMMLTDAHSSAAVCSPTRYGLLTGRYSWRTRMKRWIVGRWERPLIKPDRLTISEMLSEQGYHTACIGKWHLGWHWPAKGGGTTSNPDNIDFSASIDGGPVDRGFDYYFGDDVPNWPPYAWRENDQLLGEITTRMQGGEFRGVSPGPAVEDWSFEAVLPELADRCANYIKEQSKSDQPFFLYFSMTSPHTPIAPSDRFKGTTGISPYADFLIETDWAVGRVLEALEASDEAEETLVIFTADNGTSDKARFEHLAKQGVHLRATWRGFKADAFEGGHRVPFVVRWPDHVESDTRSDATITTVDIMATLAAVTGYDLPADAGEDSANLLPVLRGGTPGDRWHDGIVVRSGAGFLTLRDGPWKIIFCRGSGGWSEPNERQARKRGLPPVQLYHLGRDPKEQNNVADEHPRRVKQMRAQLKRFVERGRSTPGPAQNNHNGRNTWPTLPWHGQ